MMSTRPSLETRGRQRGTVSPKAEQPEVARRIQLIRMMRRYSPLKIDLLTGVDQSLSTKTMTKWNLRGMEGLGSPDPTEVRDPRWIR